MKFVPNTSCGYYWDSNLLHSPCTELCLCVWLPASMHCPAWLGAMFSV